MNAHVTAQPAAQPVCSISTTTAANDRATYLAAATNQLKLIYMRRRQMARFARIGHHIWAWQESQEIKRHKDMRRWYLERASMLEAQLTYERIDA